MTGTESSTITEHFVELPTARVHYVEAGSGHPVVLLHGSGPGATGLTNFSPNIGPLAQNFRVIAPDMPGWGESSGPGEIGYNHVPVLIDLLDALGLEKAALVGNSMGGFTSVRTAIAHPERVSHLVTMGAGAPGTRSVFSPGGGLTEGLKVLAQAYYETTAENMKRLVQVMCFDHAWATDDLAKARAEAALSHPEHLESWRQGFFQGMATNPQPPGQAAMITAPTLAIHGRDDRVMPFEGSLQLVTQVPNSRLLLLNRCGHWVQIEHADEFNREVTSFILSN